MSESPLKQNKIIALDTLIPHPDNYRQHPDEQVQKLVLSLQRFGQGRSIVIQDSPGKQLIVAGHGIVEAAKALNWPEIRADILPADWTPSQIRGYLLADNLHSQGASDDESVLARLLQEQQDLGIDLASLGTDDETLRQMMESLGDEYLGDGEPVEEREAPEPEEEQTRVRLGDVWQLGKHKIACINSCDPEQVKLLFSDAIPHMVWSDPPYGMSLDTDFDSMFTADPSHRKTGKRFDAVIGDDIPFDPRPIMSMFNHVDEQIWWGADYYADKIPNLTDGTFIVWDKRCSEEMDKVVGNIYEMAWSKHKHRKEIIRLLWSGHHGMQHEDTKSRIHPTQKPVALALWAFEKYGKERDVIYDPFLGSGISVIAAENLGRTVYGCELSPAYIDVVIKRWEQHTGQTAQLLERSEEPAHV